MSSCSSVLPTPAGITAQPSSRDALSSMKTAGRQMIGECVVNHIALAQARGEERAGTAAVAGLVAKQFVDRAGRHEEPRRIAGRAGRKAAERRVRGLMVLELGLAQNRHGGERLTRGYGVWIDVFEMLGPARRVLTACRICAGRPAKSSASRSSGARVSIWSKCSPLIGMSSPEQTCRCALNRDIEAGAMPISRVKTPLAVRTASACGACSA